MPFRSTSVTMAFSWISTPIFSSRAWVLEAQLLAHRRQHGRRRVEQDDVRLGRVDEPEAALERLIGELGDLASPSRRPSACPDHDEGQQLLAPAPFGRWTAPPARRPQGCGRELQRVVDRLHARRELGEVVVAEVRLAGARRDDEAVVGRPVGVPEQHRVDRLVVQIDVRDVAEQHLGVSPDCAGSAGWVGRSRLRR